MAFAVIACGSDDDNSPKKSGAISYAKATIEKTLGNDAFINPLTNTGDGAVTYTSSDTKVATVEAKSGLVTIAGNGSTTITATVKDGVEYTYSKRTTTYTLTVKDAVPEKQAGIIIYAANEIEKTLGEGTFTNPLTKTGDGAVSYTSSDAKVATVDAATGAVTLTGIEGTVTITATVTDSATCVYSTKTASYTLKVAKTVSGKGELTGFVKFSNAGEDENGDIIVQIEDQLGSVSRKSVTNRDGSYTFANVSPGKYTVFASCTYALESTVYTTAEVSAGKKTEVANLTLTATGTVTGTLRAGGKETGNAGIQVAIAGTDYIATTNDAGTFTISRVKAGSGYTVTASEETVKSNLVVQPNKTTDIGVIEISTPSGNFSLAVSLSTESLTNQDVTITVTPSESKENIIHIGYVYTAGDVSWDNARAALNHSSFTPISPKEDGTYSITATKNGYYTFAAETKRYYVDFVKKNINFIDKTAPAVINDLVLNYDRHTQKITATWTQPSDSDLNYVSLSYTKAGENVVTDLHATSPYIIENVAPDDTVYAFTLYSVDNAGNKSAETISSITASNYAKVKEITLSRYHIASTSADKTFTATAGLTNADRLENDTEIVFYVYEGETEKTHVTANIDKAAGLATATIIAPSTGNESTDGKTYTVLCKIGEDAVDTSRGVRFNVGKPLVTGLFQTFSENAHAYNAMISILDAVNGGLTVSVKLNGFNLDTIPVTARIIDSGKNVVSGPVTFDTSAIAWTSTTGETGSGAIYCPALTLPTTVGTYTLQVLLEGSVSETRNIIIYDVPKFSSISIPKVGNKIAGSTIKITVKGSGFKGHNVSVNNFKASCTEASIVASPSFEIVSDSEITANLKVPGTSGDFNVTVSYGNESITGTFKVYDTGSIDFLSVLLNNGSIIPNKDSFSDEEKSKAVAVMYGFNDSGIPGWVGIHNSRDGSDSGWKDGDYTVYGFPWGNADINCAETACTPSSMSTPLNSTYSTVTFSGKTDGSGNWDYIKSIDPTAESNPKYQCFKYADAYGTKYNLTGEFATGWYIPSLAELGQICKSRLNLDTVIQKLGGLRLLDYTYWSSSQYGTDAGQAWYINFQDFRPMHYYKSTGATINSNNTSDMYHAVCVRSYIPE